jgi:hypothetical protein
MIIALGAANYAELRPVGDAFCTDATVPHSASYHVIRSLLWAAGIVAVFTPLAVARYRRG